MPWAGERRFFLRGMGFVWHWNINSVFVKKKVSFKNAFSDFLIRFLRRKNFAQFRTVFTTDFEWQRSGDVNSVEWTWETMTFCACSMHSGGQFRSQFWDSGISGSSENGFRRPLKKYHLGRPRERASIRLYVTTSSDDDGGYRQAQRTRGNKQILYGENQSIKPYKL